MEKKILIIGHAVSDLMITEALAKANVNRDDIVIIQEGSEEAKELINKVDRKFPPIETRTFELQPPPIDFKDYAVEKPYNNFNRKTKGGKKNKRNWKY